MIFVFFFKQKTAYEVRISDWSSDVCSSDLVDIITFVNCTGMVEVMFTDIEYIMSKSAIKGRVAPAALVYAMSEGLLIQATMQNTGLAFLNMDLNVEKPCMAGDTIHCEVEEIGRAHV